MATFAAFTLVAPDRYWAWHVVLLPASRLAMHAVPSFRQVHVGAALMLEHPAQEGWWGVSDAARVVAGAPAAAARQLELGERWRAVCGGRRCRCLPLCADASRSAAAPRLLQGTRLLGLVVGGLVIPDQPPLVTAATQAVLLALTRCRGYCGTALLASPLTRARMAALAQTLEAACLPVQALFAPTHAELRSGALLQGAVLGPPPPGWLRTPVLQLCPPR